MQNEEHRAELANFLQTRRARLLPEQVGLPGGKRRRTPGLRREEVAQRAEISVEWYTRLEQGKDIRVSAKTLEYIARALEDTFQKLERLLASHWSCQCETSYAS